MNGLDHQLHWFGYIDLEGISFFSHFPQSESPSHSLEYLLNQSHRISTQA